MEIEMEVQAIRALSAEVFTAELDRDLDKFMSYFSPDSIIQAGDAPTMNKDEYKNYALEFFKLPYTDIPLTEPRLIEIAKSREIAYDVGPWKVVIENKDGCSELFGKSTIVWRKYNDVWKIVVMHFSMDAPAATQ